MKCYALQSRQRDQLEGIESCLLPLSLLLLHSCCFSWSSRLRETGRMTDNRSIWKGVVRSRRNLPAATRHERATTEAKARCNPTGWNTWNTVPREKLSSGRRALLRAACKMDWAKIMRAFEPDFQRVGKGVLCPLLESAFSLA